MNDAYRTYAQRSNSAFEVGTVMTSGSPRIVSLKNMVAPDRLNVGQWGLRSPLLCAFGFTDIAVEKKEFWKDVMKALLLNAGKPCTELYM